MGFCSQFRLLLWKNFKLQSRRRIATIFEIGLPTFFVIILVVLRHITLDDQKHRCVRPLTQSDYGVCEWDPVSPAPLSGPNSLCTTWFVGYTPPSAGAVVNATEAFLGDGGSATYVAYPDDDTLAAALIANGTAPGIPSGCRVGVALAGLGSANITVTLRLSSTPGGFSQAAANSNSGPANWITTRSFPDFLGQGARADHGGADGQGNDPGYNKYAFLPWLAAVHRALLPTVAASPAAAAAYDAILANAVVNRFPYPPYLQDGFLYAIQFGLPLLLHLAFLFSALSITRDIVHEKERRLKESMKMMGLYNAVHWAAWYFKCFLFLLISVIIMTALMAGGKLFQYTQISVIFVYLLFFSLTTISWSFFVSAFFSKANTAAAVSGIMWFLAYMPYFFVSPRYDTMSRMAKSLVCLLPNTAMAMGANVIAIQETNGVGVTWSNFAHANSVDDSFSFGAVLGAQLWDAIFYFLLAWYLEQVFPGEFGLPRPFYFPLQPSYWCGSACSADSDGDGARAQVLPLTPLGAGLDPTCFQPDPAGLPAGIRLQHLKKRFGDKVAVVDTSLSLYEGQITALLGHNGAGKTTTMNIITGLYPPTAGSVHVAGLDIKQHPRRVQETLGICPQHDVLFDTLTVSEHLAFFCRLKGVTAAQDVASHTAAMLRDLQLEDKRDELASTLSGGQKRRLSVGVALVGGSKVVILDEPTSGMDPAARRAIWDLLARHKRGRTMLLSTHFMDEADLLGDRIAIMADGVVKCCGDSLFLKHRYGVGYHLTCVKRAGAGSTTAAAVVAAVQRHVPSATLEGDVGAELSLLLPREHAAAFPALFDALDAARDQLALDGYGCSVTTMEEVFLRVGEAAAAPEDDTAAAAAGGTADSGLIDIQRRIDASHTEHTPLLRAGMSASTVARDQHLVGPALWRQQFRALLRKRWLHSKRNKMAILTQLLPPLLFTILSLVMAQTLPKPSDAPARSFALWGPHYSTPATTLYLANNATAASAYAADLTAAAFALAGLPAGVAAPAVTTAATAPDSASVSSFLLAAAGSTTPQVSIFNRYHPALLAFSPASAPGPGAAAVGAVAWFNGQAYHSVAESYAWLAAATLRAAANGSLAVTSVNHPLPRNVEERVQDDKSSGIGFIIAFNLVFGMAPLASSFVLFLVSERHNKAKLVQFVSGVSPLSYWASSYLWDFINFMAPSIACIFVFLGFNSPEFGGAQTGFVLLQFIFYGIAVLPLMYLFTFLFETPSVAFTRMTLFNIVTGLAAMLTVNILTALGKDSIVSTLKTAFLMLPNYCFGQGLSDLYSNYQSRALLQPVCQQLGIADVTACCAASATLLNQPVLCTGDYLSWAMPGTGQYLLAMTLLGCGFFALVLAIEYRVTARASAAVAAFFAGAAARRGGGKAGAYTVDPDAAVALDADVRAEAARVQRALEADADTAAAGAGAPRDALLVADLEKAFTRRGGSGGPCAPTRRRAAVAGLSFGVPPHECFGLLGVNGAGKTTTFKMLTGDVAPDAGTARVVGWDVRTHLTRARQHLGYCPQFDALVELLTGREVLELYARLRGVPEPLVAAAVADGIAALMLEKHADRPCGTYSGGNKRKLSTAIALVGDPAVVLLDEPTTGMDPGARRFLWDALCRVRGQGRAIVLTSHSMEECEALCTRLAVMVNGQFQCLGSPQHLKTRFGAGVGVTARVADPAQASRLKEYLAAQLPGGRVTEDHGARVKYAVPPGAASWAALFRTMEAARAELGLVDYAVAQTSLEDVFLAFAQHQEEETST